MWVQACNVILGIWLIFSPAILHFDSPSSAPATMARTIAPIVIVLGIVSLRDVTRIFRWLQFLPATWLLLCPWFLHYSPGVPLANQALVGMAIAVVAAIPGPIHKRTGGGWLSLLTILEPENPTLDRLARDAKETPQ